MYKKKLIVIDAYNFLFRAFYAMPTFVNSEGIPVGAVYGFLNMIFKYITNLPDYMAIACDTGSKTFRELIYPKYKMNRGETPENLSVQFPLFDEAIDAFDFVALKKDGYEADDIIATLATKFAGNDLEVHIFSSDKDLLQLMNENIKIFDPINDEFVTKEKVMQKFQVRPEQILDFLSLTGDASDAVPGVAGIGPITAAKLINEFGTLENLLINLDQLKKSKMKENLIKLKDDAIISKKLITLDKSVELQLTLDDLKIKPFNFKKVQKFLVQHSFKTILQKVEKFFPDISIVNTSIKSEDNVSIDYFLSLVSECGLLGLEQNQRGEIMFSTISNFFDQSNISVSLSFSESSIPNEISKLFTKKSVLKITDVNHEFLHKVKIQPWECINTMSHIAHSTGFLPKNNDILKNYLFLISKLFQKKLFYIYFGIEKKILPIIIKMEKKGVLVDKNILQDLSINLSLELTVIEKEIFALTGCEFNIASPKQLASVMFEKMQIPYPGKDKRYSTDVEIMEILEESGNLLATKILNWRTVNKLKTTYADGLIKHINPLTGRIHTTYLSTGTNTGRMSSANPNLQNIPRGKIIKRAFIAKKGHYLVSADYSQIELRVIAYLANVSNFKKILSEGGDIHAFTAREIFSVNEITEDLRQKAKAINFGIIYGITPFGLAKQLKISKDEAKLYIDSYFNQYPEIKEYMDDTKDFVTKNGYVSTKFGRKCVIDNINSPNFVIRANAQRSAINAPIQGTAADIIKKAMIEIAKTDLKDYLTMQIHDEVIFEVPEELLHLSLDKIPNIMESIDKDLYLKVSIKYGFTLASMHA